jgi:hypothetical protein
MPDKKETKKDPKEEQPMMGDEEPEPSVSFLKVDHALRPDGFHFQADVGRATK